MEGPTPVSALIHAATMVTAGVYLIARSTPLIALAPGVQLLIASIGCATALLAAAIAVTQNDLKRVMAYSTVSQLGYMFMALGAGVGDVAQLAVVAAMFHLFTHAFFKALLFLASGSVMHAMGDVIDMRRFGGLRHRMPITCWTFAVGGLALSAIPPFSGFFSKDEILRALSRRPRHAAHEQGWGWIYGLIYWVAILTAFMTAFYTGRAFFMTFFGPEKLPSPDDPEARRTPASAGAHGARRITATAGHGHAARAPSRHRPRVAAGHDVPADRPGRLHGPDRPDLPGRLAVHRRPDRVVRPPPGQDAGVRVAGARASTRSRWLTAIVGTLVGVAGIGLSYVMYAQPSPLPGAADGAAPAALRGLAAQVLRRRDLRVGRDRAGPCAGGDQRVPRHVPGGSAGDRGGLDPPG